MTLDEVNRKRNEIELDRLHKIPVTRVHNCVFGQGTICKMEFPNCGDCAGNPLNNHKRKVSTCQEDGIKLSAEGWKNDIQKL